MTLSCYRTKTIKCVLAHSVMLVSWKRVHWRHWATYRTTVLPARWAAGPTEETLTHRMSMPWTSFSSPMKSSLLITSFPVLVLHPLFFQPWTQLVIPRKNAFTDWWIANVLVFSPPRTSLLHSLPLVFQVAFWTLYFLPWAVHRHETSPFSSLYSDLYLTYSSQTKTSPLPGSSPAFSTQPCVPTRGVSQRSHQHAIITF